MSLISEALNKAQQNRAEQIAFGSYAADTFSRSRRHTPNRPVKSFTFIWANAAALAVFFVVALLYLRHRPLHSEVAPAAMPAAVTLAAAPAPTRPAPAAAAASTSPFQPSVASAASAAPAPSSEYELAGMTAMGSNTLLSITRRGDKRSVWIPVGKTVGEITAVSYDADQDRAVIRVGGRLLSVGLRDFAQPAE